jgi:hypothetical protein
MPEGPWASAISYIQYIRLVRTAITPGIFVSKERYKSAAQLFSLFLNSCAFAYDKFNPLIQLQLKNHSRTTNHF